MTQEQEPSDGMAKGLRRRILIQVLALVVVALVVGGVALFTLYRTGINQQRGLLAEVAQSQARLIEAITAHHMEVLGTSVAQEPNAAAAPAFQLTLDEVRRAHSKFQGFGETGEFTLAILEADRIVFLLSHRHDGMDPGGSLPLGEGLGEPMEAALNGRSGTMIGTDYRGTRVLAAHEPVAVPGITIGVVAKLDYAEARWPFLRTLWMVVLIGLAVISLGSVILHRLGEPLIRRLEESETRYRRFFQDSQEAMFLTAREGFLLEANQAGLDLFGVTREEIVGRDVTDFYLAAEDRDRFVQELDRSGAVKDFLTTVRLPDGSLKNVLFSAATRTQDDGTVILESVVRNVSAQKQAEEALRESESQFRSLAESSPSAIFIEQGGQVKYVNPVAVESIGYSEEEVLSPDFDWWDLIVDETAGPVIDAYQRHQRGEEVEAYEYKIRRKDGTHMDVVSSTRLIAYQGGTAILGTIADISDQKAILREVEKREHLYHTIFEFGNDGSLLLRDGRFVEGNLRALNMFGVSGDTLEGMTLWDFSPPLQPDQRSSLAKGEELLARTMDGVPQVFEWTHLRGDGSLLPVEISLTRVELEEGPAVYGVMRDLTERKEAELALMQSLKALADLAEAIPAGLFIYEYQSPDRLTFTYGNREAESQTGVDVVASVGKAFDEIWPEAKSNGLTDKLLKVMRTGETYETHDEIYRDDHLEGVFRVHAFPLPGDRLAVSFDNVTEQRRAEEEIRESNERLRALAYRLQEIREEERTHIARELHDQLGQAITSLRMDLAMLRSRLPEASGDLVARVEAMIGVADENLALVQNISSRLRPPVLDVLGLPAAVEWLVEELQPRIEMDVHLDLEAEKTQLGSGESTAIFRIIQEALTNVVRHSEGTWVKIGMSVSDEELMVRVEDNGVGIPERSSGAPRSLGLIGMHERAQGLGGTLNVGPGSVGGTLVLLSVPLKGREREGGAGS